MRNFSEARSVFYYWCVRELGESMTSLAKQLGSTQPAVGYAVDRGNEILNKAKIKLSE
jgi:putative transposase